MSERWKFIRLECSNRYVMVLTPNNQDDKRQVLKGRVTPGVRRVFSFFYPDYISEDDIFAQFIARYLRKDSLVLDAGCGSGAFFQYPWKHQVGILVGCDLSESAHCNPNLTFGVCGNLDRMPFTCGKFDVIFSRYVLEHLGAPDMVFREFARLLKPGGKLVVLTPSKYHYVTLLSRVTPHWFHEVISVLRGNSTHDALPTKYLANSKAKLVQYAKEARLTMKDFIAKEVCPNYLLWSIPSFLLGVLFERVVNHFDMLSPFRVSIIAVFEQ